VDSSKLIVDPFVEMLSHVQDWTMYALYAGSSSLNSDPNLPNMRAQTLTRTRVMERGGQSWITIGQGRGRWPHGRCTGGEEQ
jgi:hypothetical protein